MCPHRRLRAPRLGSTISGPLSQATAVLTSGLERIPDQRGYLVISEDGVLAVSPRSRDAEAVFGPRPPPSHLCFSPQVSWRTTSTPRPC